MPIHFCDLRILYSLLAAVVSNWWPFCVTASAEGCLSACTVFLHYFVSGSITSRRVKVQWLIYGDIHANYVLF